MRIGMGMGITGPQFLVAYGVGFVLALAAWWARRPRRGALAPLTLLLVAGVLRVGQGVVNGRPVGFLVLAVFGVATTIGALAGGGMGGSGCSFDCSSACSSGDAGCGGGCGGCGGD